MCMVESLLMSVYVNEANNVYVRVCVLFNGVSTVDGNLIPKPIYTFFKSYILDESREVISDALFSSPISGFASYRLQQQPRHDSRRVKPPP